MQKVRHRHVVPAMWRRNNSSQPLDWLWLCCEVLLISSFFAPREETCNAGISLAAAMLRRGAGFLSCDADFIGITGQSPASCRIRQQQDVQLAKRPQN